MEDKIYTIKEASEILELESHTLRYYEDELKLTIPRNSMGHRYYRDYDINLFKYIIDLREQGLQLKAIKVAIQDLGDYTNAREEGEETSLQTAATSHEPHAGTLDITDRSNIKVQQFQLMMKETFIQAIYENQQELRAELNSHIKYKIEEDLQEEIQKFENRYEEKDKERYRKVDEALREMQKIRRELAEVAEQKKSSKTLLGRIFRKKNEKIAHQEEYILEE